MKKLISILVILLLAAGGYLATMQTKLCRPEGMLDAEAARITAIATVQGENFRREIGEMRERGVSLRNDATYDDVLADDERTLNLAREFFYRRLPPDRIRLSRIEQGEELDEILMESGFPLKRQQVNYFALTLDQSLKDLALAIGAEPVEGSYSFLIDPQTYMFALAQFARSAGLKNTGGGTGGRLQTNRLGYGFVETWPLFRADKLANVRFSISSNLAENILTISPIFYRFYSWKDDRLSKYIFVNRGCLATFTKES